VRSWRRLGWGDGTLILTGAIAEIKTNRGVSTAHKAPQKGGR